MLRVMQRGQQHPCLDLLSNPFPEVRCPVWVPVTDNTLRYAVPAYDMFGKEMGKFPCADAHRCQDKISVFCQSIHNNENGVELSAHGEVNYEVHRNRSIGLGRDGAWGSNSRNSWSSKAWFSGKHRKFHKYVLHLLSFFSNKTWDLNDAIVSLPPCVLFRRDSHELPLTRWASRLLGHKALDDSQCHGNIAVLSSPPPIPAGLARVLQESCRNPEDCNRCPVRLSWRGLEIRRQWSWRTWMRFLFKGVMTNRKIWSSLFTDT